MPDCSCIKGNYDFLLQTSDCSKILYQDLSDWMLEDYYSIPESYNVSVLLPGRNEYTEILVSTQGTTAITPQLLGLNARCIPDGVYCFAVENCGTSYKRTKAVTCSLDCCLKSYTANIRNASPQEIDKIREIEMYIHNVHLNAEMNKPRRASEFYRIAEKELDRLNCNCNNKC